MNRVSRMLRSPFTVIVLLILAYLATAFLILPIFTVLKTTFFHDGQLSLRAIGRLANSDRAMLSLRNSFIMAVILPVTVNIVGIFVVLVTRYFDIKGARILFLGYATPLVYGGVALVAGYKFLYGSTGILTQGLTKLIPGLNENWFIGFPAVVFIMTFACTGNHLLFLPPALAKVDHQTVEAARMMGASSWKVLWTVVMPILKPMLYAVTILTVLTGLGAMAAPLIVGGKDFQTIAPMILSFSEAPSSRDLAASLGLILGLTTLVLIIGLNMLERRGSYVSVSKVPMTMQKQKISNPVANAIVHVVAWGLWVIYLLPPLFILIFSFTDARTIATGQMSASSFTLDNYRAVLGSAAGFRPFFVSIVYAALAAVIVVALMLLAARIVSRYRNWMTTTLEYVLQIPWFLPSVLMALGLVLTYAERRAIIGGKTLTGTLVLMLIGYVIIKVPFTFRLLRAAFIGINDSLEEAATLLGAKQGYILRTILLPLVIPSTAAVFALNFNSLLDDYDVSAFLANPLFQPLGLFIRSATRGETMGDSKALVFVYSILLMVISSFIMWQVYGRSGNRSHFIRRTIARLSGRSQTDLVEKI